METSGKHGSFAGMLSLVLISEMTTVDIFTFNFERGPVGGAVWGSLPLFPAALQCFSRRCFYHGTGAH